MVALGCEPSTQPGQGEGGSTGGASTDEPVAADTHGEPGDGAEATTTSDPNSTGSVESTAGDAVTTVDTSEGSTSGEDSTSGGDATSSDADSSGGGTETGGDSETTGQGNDDPCVTDCGLLVEGSEEEDFGACFFPEPGCRNDCDLPVSCGPLTYSDAMFEPDTFVANAHCFLEALSGNTPLRVEYQVAFDEYDVRRGSIFLFGDGTAALDFGLETHCGNGGSYSVHPYATGTTGVDVDFGETSGCLDSVDVFELLECTLGNDYASSIEGFPWLDDTCSDEEVTCGAS